ncbi:hypothetical protein GOP47_0028964 [Adiantum capillus-veneris]|nr:hypothetical protein GOP47_0028964 [Adiantum capillus-veneris]
MAVLLERTEKSEKSHPPEKGKWFLEQLNWLPIYGEPAVFLTEARVDAIPALFYTILYKSDPV